MLINRTQFLDLIMADYKKWFDSKDSKYNTYEKKAAAEYGILLRSTKYRKFYIMEVCDETKFTIFVLRNSDAIKSRAN